MPDSDSDRPAIEMQEAALLEGACRLVNTLHPDCGGSGAILSYTVDADHAQLFDGYDLDVDIRWDLVEYALSKGLFILGWHLGGYVALFDLAADHAMILSSLGCRVVSAGAHYYWTSL